MANPVLEGLQLFNQSVQQLGQQRILNQAAEVTQQIQQSELKDQEKRQALQQYGQQFALQAQAVGMDPSQALASGQLIGPKQPLIQTGLQAALYGTPQEQDKVNAYDAKEQQQQLDLKHAEDDRLQKMQDKQLEMQLKIARENNASREEIAALRGEKANSDKITSVGKEFRNDKVLKEYANAQVQSGAIKALLDKPNVTGLELSTAVDAYHKLVEETASRESDIQRALKGSQSLLDNFRTQIKQAKGENSVVPEATKRRILGATLSLANKAEGYAGGKRKQYRADIQNRGGDPDLYDPLNFIEEQRQQQEQQQQQQGGGGNPPAGMRRLPVLSGGIKITQ